MTFIVIGGGNARFSPRFRRPSRARKCWFLKRAPQEKRGGNSNFTGGGFRMVHHGAQDIQKGRADS